MRPFHDLLIRNGTVVLPWGLERADIGVSQGIITTLAPGNGAEAAEVIDATGLHVLPGLIDAHAHLRDPEQAAVESIPTGTRAAVLGGLCAVFDMPNTNPSITTPERLDAKKAFAATRAWCDIGLYVGAAQGSIEELAALELAEGVCAMKVFAGSTTGDLLIEDDETLEQVMRTGRRRIAYHSEDEYRLRERRPLFHEGMPYASHAEWRDVEAAFLGTRRLMALARKTGRPAHILHVSTAEELDYLQDYRDIATVEVLLNHLTQWAPDAYDRLGPYAVMNPPIRDARHMEAAWAAVRDGMVDTSAPIMRRMPGGEGEALAGVRGGADRRADARAGHARPRQGRAAVADAPGGSDVCRAGAGLRRARQGPHRARLRRRFHAGRHGPAAGDRGKLDREPLRLDAVRRHGSDRLAGGDDHARPGGDARG